jgi:protoheme IX farnesyltransferase
MIRKLIRLFRIPLALLNGIAALSGCFLFPAPVAIVNLISVFFGVTLLAIGASALNQAVEPHVDKLMLRTCLRPLPQGELSLFFVTFTGIASILSGCAILVMSGGVFPALIGFLAVVLYLSVYTPLKRKTTFALIIGALSGSMPPLIGWSLLGGNILDYRIIILSGLFFIWQIPHFGLLYQKWYEDYVRAELSFYPFYQDKLVNSIFLLIWLTALVIASLILLILNVVNHKYAVWFLISSLIITTPVLISRTRLPQIFYNTYPLILTLFIALQRNELV